MKPTSVIPENLKPITDVLVKHRWLWSGTTVVCTLLSLIYAVAMARNWSATQSFIVRDELGAGLRGLGRFDTAEAMKNAQETIQEIARNQAAVLAALKSLGPPAGYRRPEEWPTENDVRSAQSSIQVRAPNGAEFGKTEVIYVKATAGTKERAVQMVEAVCTQLERQLGELRARKSSSIIEEVENRLRLAERDLEETTKRLEKMEAQVGSDLGELRVLTTPGTGESNLRSQLNAIKTDIRAAEAQYQSCLEQQALIIAAQKDPTSFVATPNRLLESQPGLKMLKDNLSKAQEECARMAGKIAPSHPTYKAALESEQNMRQNLRDELKIALRGVESDLNLCQTRSASLKSQLQDVTQRLEALASRRAGYDTLTTEFRRANDAVEKNKKELNEAQAAQETATSVSLITRLDQPVPSDRPIGPGRSMIVAGGMFGGLFLGLGLVFLVSPMGDQSRTLTSFLPISRRVANRTGGRRVYDVTKNTSHENLDRRTTEQDRSEKPPMKTNAPNVVAVPAQAPAPQSPDSKGLAPKASEKKELASTNPSATASTKPDQPIVKPAPAVPNATPPAPPTKNPATDAKTTPPLPINLPIPKSGLPTQPS